jgi:hypothetical protein
MDYVGAMLKNHPHPVAVNAVDLETCIQACLACDQACTACADSCLGEAEVQRLVRCIRLNLDCAQVCAVTARILGRQTAASGDLIQQQLATCAAFCKACAVECEGHAHHHEHCRVCAEACRACEASCRSLIVANWN